MKRSNFIKTALLSLPVAGGLSAFSPRKSLNHATKGFKTEVLQTRYSKKIMLGETPIDFKLLGDDTDNALSVFISSNNMKGFGPPLHFHKSFDEFFCVLDGDFIFQMDDEKVPFKKGETIFVPRKVKHCFDCEGEQPGTLLVAVSPSENIEEFFAEMGDILNSRKGEPNMEALQTLYKKFDSEIVGPPLS
jgi:mannose-6-phosphate isomerase-like protein (cupin superfamily)